MEPESVILQPTNGAAILSSCPTTKKVFISEVDALQFEARNREKYQLAKQHTYKCEDCIGWHLTAVPADAFRLAKSHIYESSGTTAQRVTGSAKDERNRKILDLYTAGKNRHQIADEIDCNYQTVCTVLKSFDGDPVKRAAKRQSLSTLDDVAEQKKALLAQLEKLSQTEQQIIERKALKLLLCWEGQGILIEKEGNRFALALPDCQELVEKLAAMLRKIGS
jgi:transposase-like protein